VLVRSLEIRAGGRMGGCAGVPAGAGWAALATAAFCAAVCRAAACCAAMTSGGVTAPDSTMKVRIVFELPSYWKSSFGIGCGCTCTA
jgi:hypothetical protein